MKVIFIMADTFRRDHLGAYGNKRIHTPNLDTLASVSAVFDRHYAGSFPTGPNRRDLMLGTGDKGRSFNPWRNIDADEVTLPERLAEKGVHSMMITDVANGVVGRNMYKGFSQYNAIRGQEGDGCWSDDSTPVEYKVPKRLVRYTEERYQQVLANRARRYVEEDWFAPKTYKVACEWLERNWRRDDFFLWIETFDPHEPWDPPQWYVDRYDPGYEGRVFENPPYGFYREMGMTDREVRHTHARYCGEVTMVDHCVGRLLATLDKLDLLDEVAIVFTSDHGAYFGLAGDAGAVCKPHFVGKGGAWLFAGAYPSDKRDVTFFPLRTGTMRTPLLIKLPRQRRSRRIGHICQPWDVTPTIMDLFGIGKTPKEFHGQTLLPLVRGRKRASRPCAFNGSQQWDALVRQTMNEEYIYSVWPKGERGPNLIDLRKNPKQDKNVVKKNLDVARRLHATLRKFDPEAGEFPL